MVAAMGYHVMWGQHGYLALRHEQQEYRALLRQTDQLEQENAGLKKNIDALKNDRNAVERKAREDLLMARPGEIIIKYSDADVKRPDAANASAPSRSEPSAVP